MKKEKTVTLTVDEFCSLSAKAIAEFDKDIAKDPMMSAFVAIIVSKIGNKIFDIED